MRFARLALAAALMAPLTGCVSLGRYNEAVADAERARGQELDEQAKIAALKADVERLEADVKAREAKLAEEAVNASNLKKQSEDLVLMNAELQQRLQAAGQSVQALASERGNLSIALADTKKKLDQLSRLEAQAEARAAEMKQLARSFQGMVDAGQLKVVVRNGRLVLVLPNDVLFDSGKTALKEQGKAAIYEVAKVLRTMKNRHFEVAGHTDDVAIQSARYPSNWELSTARAVNVTKLLVEKGVDPKELSAAGYGEFAPVADNGTTDGRAKNRRIEIVLLPTVDERMLGK
ncbi:MAG TPA: OmpA family protein [Minicystis sp.]|nr:OmpA family protein [Minicystis sp.]